MSQNSTGYQLVRFATQMDMKHSAPIADMQRVVKGTQLIIDDYLVIVVSVKQFMNWLAQQTKPLLVSIYEDPPGTKTKPSLTTEAEAIIYGDREATYGDPSKNLRAIAAMWSAYLGTEVTATQVCDMMVLLKVARLKNTPQHRDSMVDIIGYTLLKERC